MKQTKKKRREKDYDKIKTPTVDTVGVCFYYVITDGCCS